MLTDPAAGERLWLASALSPFGGRVRDLVPSFPHLLRLFHRPADGRWWNEVAKSNGRVTHALMQWERICNDSDERPTVGALDPLSLEAFSEHIGDGPMWGATWTGWGGSIVPTTFPLLRLPQREYSMAMDSFIWLSKPTSGQPLSCLWPADHSWIMATGIDFDVTVVVVGGGAVAVTPQATLTIAR